MEFRKYSHSGAENYRGVVTGSTKIGKILYSHAGMTKETVESDLIIICDSWSSYPFQWLTGTSGSNTFVVVAPMVNDAIGNLVYDRYTNNGIIGSFIRTSNAVTRLFRTSDGGKNWFFNSISQGYPSNGVFVDVPGECIMYSFPLVGTDTTTANPRPVYNALTVSINENVSPTIVRPNDCFSYQLLSVVKRANGSYLAVGKTYVNGHDAAGTTASAFTSTLIHTESNNTTYRANNLYANDWIGIPFYSGGSLTFRYFYMYNETNGMSAIVLSDLSNVLNNGFLRSLTYNQMVNEYAFIIELGNGSGLTNTSYFQSFTLPKPTDANAGKENVEYKVVNTQLLTLASPIQLKCVAGIYILNNILIRNGTYINSPNSSILAMRQSNDDFIYNPNSISDYKFQLFFPKFIVPLQSKVDNNHDLPQKYINLGKPVFQSTAYNDTMDVSTDLLYPPKNISFARVDKEYHFNPISKKYFTLSSMDDNSSNLVQYDIINGTPITINIPYLAMYKTNFCMNAYKGEYVIGDYTATKKYITSTDLHTWVVKGDCPDRNASRLVPIGNCYIKAEGFLKPLWISDDLQTWTNMGYDCYDILYPGIFPWGITPSKGNVYFKAQKGSTNIVIKVPPLKSMSEFATSVKETGLKSLTSIAYGKNISTKSYGAIGVNTDSFTPVLFTSTDGNTFVARESISQTNSSLAYANDVWFFMPYTEAQKASLYQGSFISEYYSAIFELLEDNGQFDITMLTNNYIGIKTNYTRPTNYFIGQFY